MWYYIPRLTEDQATALWFMHVFGTEDDVRPHSIHEIAEQMYSELGYETVGACKRSIYRMFKRYGLETRNDKTKGAKWTQAELIDFGYRFLRLHGPPLHKKRYRRLKPGDFPSENTISSQFPRWGKYRKRVELYTQEVEACQ